MCSRLPRIFDSGFCQGTSAFWLCRSEWYSADPEPKGAEAVFEGAEAAKNRYVADIPRMKKIIAGLDSAMNTSNDAEAWRHGERACRLFNSRWKSTPTRNFVHKPLRDVNVLARDMARLGSIDEDQADATKSIAKGSLANVNAQRDLRSLLKEAAVY